jgi:hypothetical protein
MTTSSWSCPERRDDLAGNAGHANHLSDRVLDTEELRAHGTSDHTHVRGALDVVLRESGPLVDDPSFDVEVFRRHPPVGRMPVLISVDDLDRIVHVGGNALDQRDLILDGHRVGDRQGCRVSRAGAHSADGPTARFDPDEIVAEIVELLLDAHLAGLADGDDADHCRDPDRDPEDRQKAPHFVPEQRHQSGSKQARVVQNSPAGDEPGDIAGAPNVFESLTELRFALHS